MTPTDADRLKAQVEQNHHKSLGQAPGLFVLLHIYASLQIR